MRKVEAIIKPFKLEEVKDALWQRCKIAGQGMAFPWWFSVRCDWCWGLGTLGA